MVREYEIRGTTTWPQWSPPGDAISCAWNTLYWAQFFSCCSDMLCFSRQKCPCYSCGSFVPTALLPSGWTSSSGPGIQSCFMIAMFVFKPKSGFASMVILTQVLVLSPLFPFPGQNALYWCRHFCNGSCIQLNGVGYGNAARHVLACSPLAVAYPATAAIAPLCAFLSHPEHFPRAVLQQSCAATELKHRHSLHCPHPASSFGPCNMNDMLCTWH